MIYRDPAQEPVLQTRDAAITRALFHALESP